MTKKRLPQPIRTQFRKGKSKEAATLIAQQIEAGQLLHEKSRNMNAFGGFESVKGEDQRWFDFTSQILENLFTTNEERDKFRYSRHYGARIISAFGNPHQHMQQEFKNFQDNITASINVLLSLRDRLPIFEEEEEQLTSYFSPAVKAAPSFNNKKVFVVHGHDESLRHEVENFLYENGLEPVILHKQLNQGKTIIEKFEAHSDVGFAIVLLTPDDEGRKRADTQENILSLQARERQNVILELGYFMGKLERSNVCALVKGDIEKPSDYDGVLYEPYDAAGLGKVSY